MITLTIANIIIGPENPRKMPCWMRSVVTAGLSDGTSGSESYWKLRSARKIHDVPPDSCSP